MHILPIRSFLVIVRERFVLHVLTIVFWAAVPGLGRSQQINPQSPSGSGIAFKPVEIAPSPDGKNYVGRFLFTNNKTEEVRIFGFTEPEDGKFCPRFIQFQEMQNGVWGGERTLYCTTGANDFSMPPSKSCEFIVSLWGFKERASPVTGRIEVDGFLSDPFVLDWRHDRNVGRFAAARKSYFQKVRGAFAQAGFKKDLLESEDFCTRLLHEMMQKTSEKRNERTMVPFEGELDVTPSIELNGNIRFTFSSDKLKLNHCQYRGLFVINPRKFTKKWLEMAMRNYVNIGESGEGIEMELDDGTSFWTRETTFYLRIKYEPFEESRVPSRKDAQVIFYSILDVIYKWCE